MSTLRTTPIALIKGKIPFGTSKILLTNKICLQFKILSYIKTSKLVEPAEFSGTPQNECFEGEKEKPSVNFCASNSEHKPQSECFDAGSGKPVGGIEPLNISYCTINFSKKKEQIYCSILFHIKTHLITYPPYISA